MHNFIGINVQNAEASHHPRDGGFTARHTARDPNDDGAFY
jgi:hypothetical protein